MLFSSILHYVCASLFDQALFSVLALTGSYHPAPRNFVKKIIKTQRR